MRIFNIQRSVRALVCWLSGLIYPTCVKTTASNEKKLKSKREVRKGKSINQFGGVKLQEVYNGNDL